MIGENRIHVLVHRATGDLNDSITLASALCVLLQWGSATMGLRWCLQKMFQLDVPFTYTYYPSTDLPVCVMHLDLYRWQWVSTLLSFCLRCQTSQVRYDYLLYQASPTTAKVCTVPLSVKSQRRGANLSKTLSSIQALFLLHSRKLRRPDRSI